MRFRFPLAGLAFVGIVGTSSAAVEVVTGIRATANGWDTRTSGYGCAPNGCVPANVLDASIAEESRWSCKPSESGSSICVLMLFFDEPQDIVEIRMALYKGDERTRFFQLTGESFPTERFQATPTTLEYVPYNLSGIRVNWVLVQTNTFVEAPGDEIDVWFAITGIQFMKESEVEVFPPLPAPTSEDYVGCFNDMFGDRVMSTVETDDALTLEVCAAKCGETNEPFYALEQGNECWCAGYEITDQLLNREFDRHGRGTCNTPCAGDATTACGGDMAISLYQPATSVTTPAPTPAVPASDCPSGSTEASLHIVATSRGSVYGDFQLFVVEPGETGVIVSEAVGRPFCDRGDVGVWAKSGDGGLPSNGTLSAVYVTMNGLNVTEDAVLGDYEVWGTALDGTEWTITARSNGELLWVKGGTFADSQEETERFVATVTSYADSDCKNTEYGQCPQNTSSSDGTPPCTKCPEGVVSRRGSTHCTVSALRSMRVPEALDLAMRADAVGGWAGPGRAFLDGGESFRGIFVVEGEELAMITVSGRFEKDDDTVLHPSTALFLYLHNENSESDFVRGQGEIDPTSGNFTATLIDIPVGYSRFILSFVVLGPVDAVSFFNDERTAFAYDVVNEGCSEALRIKLEWDSDARVNLWVTDPNGNRVTRDTPATDLGYVNDRYDGDPNFPNTDINPFEEYVLFSGLSGDAMLGEYRIFARSFGNSAWTITATVNGLVEWVEEGVFVRDASLDDTFYVRRLDGRTYFDDDFYNDRYYDSTEPQTETFTVTLDSYDPVGC